MSKYDDILNHYLQKSAPHNKILNKTYDEERHPLTEIPSTIERSQCTNSETDTAQEQLKHVYAH